MKTFIVIGLAAALAGCAAAQQRQVLEDVEASKAACRSQTFKTKVEFARCINGAEQKLAAIYNKHDLLQLRLASRLAIAEKQDKGQISDVQAELEFAQVNAGLGSQEAMRNSNAEMAAAATAMATPRSTTCNRIGNSVACF